MHIGLPKHVKCGTVSVQSWRNFVDTATGYSLPTPAVVIDAQPLSVKSPSLFYETHRGYGEINNVAHAKVVGQGGLTSDLFLTEMSKGKYLVPAGRDYKAKGCWVIRTDYSIFAQCITSGNRLNGYYILNIFVIFCAGRPDPKGRSVSASQTHNITLNLQKIPKFKEAYCNPERRFKTVDDAFEWMARSNVLADVASRYSSDLEAASWRTQYTLILEGISTKPPRKLNSSDFFFGEMSRAREDPWIDAPVESGYWYNNALQHAFLDALQSVPRLNENSISNIVEIVGFIKTLVVDHRVELPKSLSDIWLAYRYQYKTSTLDAEEAIKFVHRYMDLGGLDRTVTCRGTYTFDYKESVCTMRCQLDITPRELELVGRIWRSLYTYGLAPSFYVVWDMIPYSFIVDWFIPVGDIMSVLDASQAYSEDKYDISNCMFSLTYQRVIEGQICNFYTRIKQPFTPRELQGLYWFEKGSASEKTKGMRVLDAMSLIAGH